MTIFDLLFLLAALALVITLVTVVFLALRGQGRRAAMRLWLTAIVVVVYFAVLVVVSKTTPRRVVPLGEAQCFDDWCITAVSAVRAHAGGHDALRVVVRLSSRALRVSQSERGVHLYLLDGETRYDVEPEANVVPLSVTLAPNEAVTTSRLFQVPATVNEPLLVVAHGAFPGCCIIGNEQSLFHQLTVMRLQ